MEANSPREIELWFWEYTDDFGRRRMFPCRLTEENAKYLRDPKKIEGTLERRKPNPTGAYFRP